MFLLVPFNTDAPVYHWPYATVGLILFNTLVFFVIQDPSPYILDPYVVMPQKWITSIFVHGNIFHLAGNLLFLWGFGLVVEGKIGLYRFLAVYLGIGILHSSLEQGVMIALGHNGASYGASSIIYGLMTISLIWAPKNEFSCYLLVFFFRIIATTFDLSILAFSCIYLGLQFFIAAIFGFQFGSAMLHLSGALIGGVIGYVMLANKWVDCEGWDLISVMRNEHARPGLDRIHSRDLLPEADYQLTDKKGAKKKTSKKKKEVATDDDDQVQNYRREKRLSKIRALLQEDKPLAALAEYQNTLQKLGGFTLNAQDLKALANGLVRQKSYREAVPLYEQYLERFPDLSPRIRLQLASIYLEVEQRPRAALRLLEPITPDSLNDAQSQKRIMIERRANQMIDEGVIELQGRSWS